MDRAWAEGDILALVAMLNGTCNFVLDRCADGSTLERALEEAQAAGFAELDPTDDLAGDDAERKLRILRRHAFDDEPDLTHVDVLDERVAERVRRARVARLFARVARAFYRNRRLTMSIDFEELAPSSPLGSLTREWNGLEIEGRPGTRFVKGPPCGALAHYGGRDGGSI